MNNFGTSLTALYDAIIASFLGIYSDLAVALWETIIMVVASTIFSIVLGFALALFMIVTGPHGLKPNPRVYRVIDVSVNLLRSLPFIILIIAIMPLTRLVMGTGIGTIATIMPLTIAAAPFAARLIEGSFLEVDKGVVEAARSFGANRWQVIFKVMLPEAMPSLILNIAILAITLIGYSAMAGTVGGGGLGDLAYRLGYNRFQPDAIAWCVLLLIALVQIIQSTGNLFYKKLR